MAPPISSRKLLSVALLSVSPSRPCLSRRDLGITAAAILSAVGPQRIALAYDSVPAVSADLAKLEEARAARAARLEANRKKLQPYLDALSAAKNADSFSQAADKLALWIIGEGTLPDGISAPAIRDAVNEAYKALPVKPYACEPTRTNDGVCYTPGANADDAYKLCLRELRKYATAKGKGALQSDGVSAANMAAF